jgi:hypothetical protein
METSLIILIVIAVGAIGVFVATKYLNLFKDEDKNGIPDKVEEKIEEAKEVIVEVKKRAKNVAKEVKDVAKVAKKVVKEVNEVADAAAGKPKKGRKPKQK